VTRRPVYPKGALLGIHKQARERLTQAAVANMKISFIDALKDISEQIVIQFTDWGNRFAAVTDNHHSDLLSQHLETLGRAAQLETMNMYEELIVRHEGAASATHYRAGVGRLAGGILMNALGRRDFFNVSGNTLSWGNIEMLDASAHHWGRLAFGAGGRGAGIYEHKEITFEGMALTTIGIQGDPSPPFSMPRGIWLKPGSDARGKGPRGADQFYPTNSSRPTLLETAPGVVEERPNLGRDRTLAGREGVRPGDRRSTNTRGIQTRDFFKAGLELMTSQDDGLPKVISTYLHDLTGQWAQEVAQRRVVDVNVRSRGVR
jgi:hypothetical protein